MSDDEDLPPAHVRDRRSNELPLAAPPDDAAPTPGDKHKAVTPPTKQTSLKELMLAPERAEQNGRAVRQKKEREQLCSLVRGVPRV